MPSTPHIVPIDYSSSDEDSSIHLVHGYCLVDAVLVHHDGEGSSVRVRLGLLVVRDRFLLHLGNRFLRFAGGDSLLSVCIDGPAFVHGRLIEIHCKRSNAR